MNGQRRLLLLRHAKALAARPGQSDASDHARPLSERGRRDAAAMGQRLRSRGLMPALALVSTALRTRETFDLLGDLPGDPPGDPPGSFPEDRPGRILLDALYLAEPATLLDTVRKQGGSADSVMLVGHNPGLHALAQALAGGDPALAEGFPTCGLALFTVEGEWPDLAPGRAILRDVLRP